MAKHWFVFVLMLFFVRFSLASEFRLDVDMLPENGLLIQNLDFGAAMRWSNLDSIKTEGTELRWNGVEIPVQLTLEGNRGQIIALFPMDAVSRSHMKTLSCVLKLTNSDKISLPATEEKIVTETPVYRITQNKNIQGGLPSKIDFKKTGRILETHRWFDRLHHAERQASVAQSKDVKLSVASDGPICRIVRQEIVLAVSGKTVPPMSPKVVYHWFFFKTLPGLIRVTVHYSQPEPVDWMERHFLELHIPDGSFGEFSDVNKPSERHQFEGKKNTLSIKGAALRDGPNRISMFGSGSVTVYDGLKTGFGPYMLANGSAAWKEWSETTGHESVWLHIDAGESEFGENFYTGFETQASAKLSIPELDASAKTWIDMARNSMFYAGIIETKKESEAFQIDNKRFYAIQSDKLGMLLEKVETEKDQGLRLTALVDIPSLKLLTPHEPQSLFTVKLREVSEKREESNPGFTVRNLNSDHGWQSVNFQTGQNIRAGIVTFLGRPEFSNGESVRFRFALSAESDGIQMFWLDNAPRLPENLMLESTTLPTIRLTSFGNRMKAFYPQASGIVIDKPFNQSHNWSSRYPSGWATMPWYAIWDEAEKKEERIGLYIAAHDIFGATKEQSFRSDPQSNSIFLSQECPAQNMGRNHATYVPYRAVLETFRGDWFDAAQKYRDWVRHEASWYPRDKMGPEGRTDTPQWMKELAVWAIDSAMPEKMPELLRKFQQPLGVPTGLHWYNWHQIPFDNDYPHYFPVKDGFKAAVEQIQKDGDLFVMPYINGRLWDTRDRGIEDWLFTKQAFPGVAKKEDGTPYTETYGSKESDGSKVELGVMCPTSKVWIDKQWELIKRLTWLADDDDMGVRGVYVDQVAAAAPVLCFDESHGHPLGGGAWWVSAYKKMFEQIRAKMPKDAMLTTECNAEPFIDLFDGYLTWHFQHDGQVPAFAAVYGGAIQMFGRAYGGGPDMIIASRMKMAQSFVFGEQLGWIPLHVVNEPNRYDFFKKTVILRYKFRDYFYKGEMARPPKLLGDMPTVTADWHFSNHPTIVTLDVVQTGAWMKPKEKSVILLFANFSDQSKENRLQVDLMEWGLDPDTVNVVRHNSDGSEQKLDRLPDTLRFESQDAFVLELVP